jgi:hypothetical protein
MDGGIITLPLRAGLGGARVLLRTAASATGCAARLGGKATIAATRTVARVSDTVKWGRSGASFEPAAEQEATVVFAVESEASVVSAAEPGASVVSAAEPEASVVSDLRPAPSVSEPSVNGDLAEAPRTQAPRAPEVAPPPRAPEVAPPLPGPEPLPSAEPTHVSEEPELVAEVAEPGAEDGAGAAVTVGEPWPGYARMTAKQVIERLADATPAELAAVQLYESINRDRQTVRAAAERNLKTKTGRGSPE